MILKGSLAESATGPYTEGIGPAGRAASTASRRRPTREPRASPARERTRRGSGARSRASAARRRAVRGRWRTSRPPRHYFRRRGRAIPSRRAVAAPAAEQTGPPAFVAALAAPAGERTREPAVAEPAPAKTELRLASSAHFPAAAASWARSSARARARPNHEPVRNREWGTSLGGTSERVARPTSRRSGTRHTGTSRCSLENEPRAPSRSRNRSGRSRGKSPRAQSPGVVERPLAICPTWMRPRPRIVRCLEPPRSRPNSSGPPRRPGATRLIRRLLARAPRAPKASRRNTARRVGPTDRRRTVYRRPAPGSTRFRRRRASSWGLHMREPGQNPCADVDRGELLSNFVVCYI